MDAKEAKIISNRVKDENKFSPYRAQYESIVRLIKKSAEKGNMYIVYSQEIPDTLVGKLNDMGYLLYHHGEGTKISWAN